MIANNEGRFYMPTVSTTLPDITQSVFRPVVVDVANQVRTWTKIAENAPLWFPNDEGYFHVAGTGLDNKDDRLMRSESQRRLEIKATETYAEDQQVTDITGQRNNYAVFWDRPLDAWISPTYTTSTITMDFAYFTTSKEETRRWRDDVANRYLQGRYALNHQITYSYNLPMATWNLIYQLYCKRENKAGYGETFQEYFKKCTTNRLEWISNEIGCNMELTVCEKSDRIQGFFSFTNDPDKPEFDQATGNYVIRFQYTFTYQRPSSLDMHYPVIVHQQLLDAPYIEFVNKGEEYDDRAAHRSQWLWSLKPYENMDVMRYLKPRYPFIRIPEVDDYQFNYAFPGTGAYLTVLLQQEREDDRSAFNLKHLGDVVIDPDILEFLAAGEYEHIGVPGKSIFHFDVFRGKQLLQWPSVSLDKDLNLSLAKDVDLRKEYRVRCALFTNLSMIDRAALDRLMEHPKAFMKVLGAINDVLRWDASFQKMGDQRHIFPWQLSKLYEAVQGQGITNIYTGPTRSLGGGVFGTNWLNQDRHFLSDIPKGVLRALRENRRGNTDCQIFGIASWNRDRRVSREAAAEYKLT